MTGNIEKYLRITISFVALVFAVAGCVSREAQFVMQAEEGNIKDVQRLVESGVDINAKNSRHQTALFSAALACRIDVLQYLIQEGAEINARDNWNRNALHYMAYSSEAMGKLSSELNCVKVFKLLLKNGIEVNAKDIQGNTPLHRTVLLNNLLLARLLLESGSDKSIQNNLGQTPLALAESRMQNDYAEADTRKELAGLIKKWRGATIQLVTSFIKVGRVFRNVPGSKRIVLFMDGERVRVGQFLYIKSATNVQKIRVVSVSHTNAEAVPSSHNVSISKNQPVYRKVQLRH
ncbi:MAG: ankyrin repeat domain-containing protein [Leptospiraceae bacterium]|nr:ankyrin repeat domain-containing protein [Leptospiraceae bacterium]